MRLMGPVLEGLAAVKAAVDELKGLMGDPGRKESLLAILDWLDEIDVGLDEVRHNCFRQEVVFHKLKRSRVQQRSHLAGN